METGTKMPKRHLPTLCLLLTALAATPCTAQELLLYAPQPATREQAPVDPSQGILVKTVTVKRGDTLRKLSRKHLGVASWFPQVLLFNSINNPDLIYPGDRLLVPVASGKDAAAEGSKAKKTVPTARPAGKVKRAAAPSVRKVPAVKPGEKESFQRAKRAYLDRDYRQALDKFSIFLREYPQSRLAADAALYRANCYLRLSGE